MRRPLTAPLLSLIALAVAFSGLGILGSSVKRVTPDDFPAPTQHVLRKDAEKENKLKREEWIESLHRAAPGTDWKAIERVNRQTLALERQTMVEQGHRTDLWTEIGSANLAGRTHATAYAESDNSLYVGSDGGGVWKGTLGGNDWVAISDAIGYGSHGLLVVPGTPEVLITITNDGAVHATTNGGQLWFVPEGLPEYSMECVRILRDLGSPRTVYLLMKGSAYYDGSYHAGFHVLRSTDGGLNFEVAHTETGYTSRCDMWIDRVNPGPLYLMARNVMKISYDNGDTFTEVGSIDESIPDVVLTGSEAGGPTFYVAAQVSGEWKIYRSTDGGANWTWRHNIQDWWRTLVASIEDPDICYYAGVECFRTTNGGLGWGRVNYWWEYYDDPVNMLHADHPGGECIWIDGQEVFFLDTDGGTYASFDGVGTVQNISLHNLGISQYYDIFTSQTDPYLIAAGSQDQGYQVSVPEQGTPYLDFIQHISGDYGHLTSTVRDHNYLYSVYPGFTLVQISEDEPGNLAMHDFPSCNHSWLPPIVADPHDENIYYLCADHLWKHERTSGTHWAATEMPHEFSPGYVSGLAMSQADTDYWYAVTSQGGLWFSRNAGDTWNRSFCEGPPQHYFYGTSIITSPTDPNVAWVGGAGYSNPAVYKTVDGGVNWTPMGDGLPETLVFGLILDNAADQNLFAAAESGAYWFCEHEGVWRSIMGTEAPLTRYWCLESVPELDVIRFGTYGRGIWDYQIPALEDVEEFDVHASTSLRIAPNPASDRATISLDLPVAGSVTVEVFDVRGRRLATLADGEHAAGTYDFTFDLATDRGAPLRNGIYLVRTATERGVETEKLQVVR